MNAREMTVELVTAGLLVLTFVLFLLGVLTEGFAMLIGGLVLLGSGIYQTSKGWHVSLLTWILGLILTLGGIGLRLYLVGRIQISWVPLALILVALYVIWNGWRRRRS